MPKLRSFISPRMNSSDSLIEPLISKEELAHRLGVSASCIGKWQRQRRVPSYRFGRRCRRYNYQEVLTTLARYRAPALQRFKRRVALSQFPPMRPLVQAVLTLPDPLQLNLLLGDPADR